jgi:hypothetical protein
MIAAGKARRFWLKKGDAARPYHCYRRQIEKQKQK